VTGSENFYDGEYYRRRKPATLIIRTKNFSPRNYISEFKQYFPDAAVHYLFLITIIISPKPYIPHTDTYIEKEAQINEEIDRLRHAARNL